MLTCIYHPVNPMRVVESEIAEDLLASGVWFDNPTDAKCLRADVEAEIKQIPKVRKPRKPREKPDER